VSFGAPYFLLGTLFALAIGALLLLGSVASRRAVRRFGDPERVYSLQTADPSKRRAYKGLLLVLATALAFVAAARPQYGKGSRLIPATNIDVVIVLDYSKSMYAQDVEPSRIFRAKVEVSRLVKDLPGARFGAVAFAGEPMGLPLSADGSAIAQFFRQLDPNDMPVGGTAIARALDHARNLLNRDPKSADHKRIILLVTDGEDLEGDPITVARSIGGEGTTIHVVQIGGRTPERIPEVGPDGKILGYRSDQSGRPLTTSLSVEGEKQLAGIAEATPGGQIVRAEHGSTGIEKVAAEIRAQMKGELSERVETVYADIYFYPLGLAILLLVVEVFLTETSRRVFVPRRAPVEQRGSASPPLQLGGLPSFLAGPAARSPKKKAAPVPRGASGKALAEAPRELVIEPIRDKETPRGPAS
jgi:Ca-activated chloride channel family protein